MSDKTKTPIFENIRLDFGVRNLIPQWKAFFQLKGLKEDVLAGITVGCVAVPLSLAIALASGVTPAVGLTTSIVAGVICAFFGGTALGVSGPAAAMSVLIASVVAKHGVSGLLIVGFACGALQILSGVLGFGKFVRLIPIPVIEGFTAGIGAIILLGQLPKALGLPEGVTGLSGLGEINSTVAILSLSTFFIVKFSPKLIPALPGPLVGVLVPTAIVTLFNIQVPLIGEIPRSLPLPQFPSLAGADWPGIVSMSVVVFIVASLETLLSSSVVDKLTKTSRHDSDQELIGQGLGNLAVSCMGGIPVTGVIARSALNVKSGATSRRSAIFHSLTIVLAIFAIAPWMAAIPIAALAGVLIAVASSMLQPQTLMHLWKTSRGEGIVYLTTFLVLVAVDLIAGIQAGFVAAAIIGLVKASYVRHTVLRHNEGFPIRITLTGSLTFLSTTQFEEIRNVCLQANRKYGLALDFSQISLFDASGAHFLVELTEELQRLAVPVVFKGMREECKTTLSRFDSKGVCSGLHVSTEREIERRLSTKLILSPRDRILHGVQVFKDQDLERYKAVFEELADSQSPHTLFITCSDSRIQPNLITSTEPGELFIVRNVGNIIPPFGKDETPAEGAAIEYAIGILKVREIIVCGHYGCGAMATLFSGIDEKAYPSVARWLADAQKVRQKHPEISHADQATEKNVLLQLEHLKTYPLVQESLKKGLQLRAWIKDLKHAEILEWDLSARQFRAIGALELPLPHPKPEPRPIMPVKNLGIKTLDLKNHSPKHDHKR